MGMPITVDVRDPGAKASTLDLVFTDLVRIDAIFSPFRADSAVSRINAGMLSAQDADPLVREVLDLCRAYELVTEGYFNAWRDKTLDPSGLVKGWAIARAAAILDDHGHRDYFVDAAGDVTARGHAAPGAPWRIGIRHPVERDKVVRVILATDLAVATSGTYEKGAHIYDPHTGRSAQALISMTVVGPSILDADVFATAAFAMGLPGLDFIERREGYAAYAIDPELQGHWTSGFARHCENGRPS